MKINLLEVILSKKMIECKYNNIKYLCVYKPYEKKQEQGEEYGKY
jgi:hypothetical protein